MMFDEVHGRERLFMTQIDGHPHTARRNIVGHVFKPRNIAELGVMTERFANDVFDSQLSKADAADMEHCSWKLPALVMATVLGAPVEDTDLLVSWCDMVEGYVNFGGHGEEPLEKSYEAHCAFSGYTLGMLDDHRSGRRRTEVMSSLTDAAGDAVLNEDELKAQMLEILLGGFETTRVLMCAGLYHLLNDRQLWDWLVEEPTTERASLVTEEMLRIVSPIQWTGRIALDDMKLHGVHIPKRSTITPMIGAANRDPDFFPNPDIVDFHRPNLRDQIAFGQGRHYCLGQALARLEGSIWFRTLATRFPQMELTTTGLVYHGNAAIRRPKALKVKLGDVRNPASEFGV
jgi:cytochrome P450